MYPFTALIYLYVLHERAVQSRQAHALSLNSHLLIATVEDRIKSPQIIKMA